MKSEDAMIYSYGFATISSVIPAFTGQGDLLIVYFMNPSEFSVIRVLTMLFKLELSCLDPM
jgi:hypothetical protein